MKISILLPYKENFSPTYAGAVSLFVKDTVKLSKYKKNITVFGNTNLKNIFRLTYQNINLNKNLIQSGSKLYVDQFLKYESNSPSDLIEIHNRPNYFHLIHNNLQNQLLTEKNYYLTLQKLFLTVTGQEKDFCKVSKACM